MIEVGTQVGFYKLYVSIHFYILKHAKLIPKKKFQNVILRYWSNGKRVKIWNPQPELPQMHSVGHTNAELVAPHNASVVVRTRIEFHLPH